jgi:hypothetical protein
MRWGPKPDLTRQSGPCSCWSSNPHNQRMSKPAREVAQAYEPCSKALSAHRKTHTPGDVVWGCCCLTVYKEDTAS